MRTDKAGLNLGGESSRKGRDCDPRFNTRLGGIVTDFGLFPSEPAFRLWLNAIWYCRGV